MNPEEFTGGPIVTAEPETPELEEREQEQQQTGSQERDYEAEAREHGWVPKDKWRGDPNEWTDAETFVKLGERAPAELRRDVRVLTNQIDELKRTVQEFDGWRTKAEERAYKRALDDVRREMREAASEADMERFQAAERRFEQLQDEAPAKQPSKAAQPSDPAFDTWHEKNQWYGDDLGATAFADQVGAVAAQRGLRGMDLYRAVEKEVRRTYPDLFKNPRRDQPAAVEGGNGMAKPGRSRRSYENLPPDAKQACDRFVKAGIMTREEYVRDYEWE